MPLLLGIFSSACGSGSAESEQFAVTKTEAEWKEELTPEQFQVLRKEGTERSQTSPLLHEKRDGVFVCAACRTPLFSSLTKYKSGTGWPSYYAPIDAANVGLKDDLKLWGARTEVHCATCGGHLGHVFKDGPKPTGLRYCINGAAMKFTPKAKSEIKQAEPTVTRKDIKH